jgi:two-component system osmolarity sensor histidine kinase EnvZ
MIFKRYLPRSLFARALLILLLPLVVLQIVLSLSFIQRHFDGVATQMAGGMAREINAVVAAVEDAESGEEARARLAALSRLLDTRFVLAEGAVIPREALRRFYDISGGAVEETLKADVSRPMTLDLVSSDRFIEAEIQTRRGILRAALDRRRMIPSNPHQLLVVTGIASLLLVAVSIVFLRNQVRPIRQLAEAADAFGRGVSVPFEPRGAEEVRRAGAAFLAMRDRIERHVEQRTRLLSGVSHDLRTPLTRMKLALAMLDGGGEVAE